MNRKDFETSITIMPNGQIFAGEHDSMNGYPRSSLIGSFKYDRKTRAIKKTIINNTLSSLSASVASRSDLDMSSLKAATNIADSTNLSHLQMLRLYPEIQGTPNEYFYLDELFVPRDVPQLQQRETFYDTTATAEYKGRLEESKQTISRFDEIQYNLLKLTDKVYTPIEDMMRTIINPQTIDLQQLAWGFKWKRNQTAATALATLPASSTVLSGFTFGTNNTTLDNPTLIAAGAFHNTNKVATQLAAMFNYFLKQNDVKITHVAMNTTDFMNFAENTWTVSGPANIEPIRLAGGGIVPLPGIPGVTAIVDVAVPQSTMYAVNKPNALRLGEGPKIMRRFYDEERDAEAIKVLDFNQYLAVNPQLKNVVRNYGMIIPISTTT